MMKQVKKWVAAGLALAMAASLASCGEREQKPQTAEELAERFAALEDAENFQLTGTLSAKVSVSESGYRMDIPLDMKFDYDFVGRDFHVVSQTSFSLFGVTMDTQSETYFDSAEDTRYIRQDEGDWKKTAAEESKFDADSLTGLPPEVFREAGMTYDRDAKSYTVTMKAEPLFRSEAFQELLSALTESELMDSYELDDERVNEVLDALGEGDLTWVYDDTYHLRHFTLQNMRYEGDLPTNELFTGTLSASLEVDLAYDGYGSVDAASVQVPDSVRDSAVEDQAEDFTGLFGSDDTEGDSAEEDDTEVLDMIDLGELEKVLTEDATEGAPDADAEDAPEDNADAEDATESAPDAVPESAAE